MPDLLNFSVKSVGQQVRVFGDIVNSSNQSQVLNTFGPNGTSFVTWFQQLPVAAQEEFVNRQATEYMMRNLLGQWPL